MQDVGPDNDAVKALIERKLSGSAMAALTALAKSALALGGAAVLPRHFRVIRRLSEYGFFRAGGVLIGTHAFLAFGNMLGVVWGDSSRAQDSDFAHAGPAGGRQKFPDVGIAVLVDAAGLTNTHEGELHDTDAQFHDLHSIEKCIELTGSGLDVEIKVSALGLACVKT